MHAYKHVDVPMVVITVVAKKIAGPYSQLREKSSVASAADMFPIMKTSSSASCSVRDPVAVMLPTM